ncbi:hypothetical protein AMJ39_04745 [candidate division TA06 bacterium DG_24]|uniref:Periplasmic copper-binding protein NosD beta helix domain-containing protein n=2 Tax=Bacteria division TA06 TaxID=1156500 RepID=A0A0S7WUZ8_UNCT6|nr:MAG: hypothetical protein AMJ39_04745 [candidate division TA06 bacterium DG_24]
MLPVKRSRITIAISTSLLRYTPMSTRMSAVAAASVLLVVACGTATAYLLQSVYDSAGPGEGYDKLVILDPAQFYSGSLIVEPGTSCVLHGSGAIISLGTADSILASGPSTLLDMDHCVVIGGTYGVHYGDQAQGSVVHNTFFGNKVGIAIWDGTAVTAKNNIIADAAEYGIAKVSEVTPYIAYNDVWSYGMWPYAELCWS